MKQRIAVVGNRESFTYQYVAQELDKLITKESGDVTLISGGAVGVDSFAQEYAKKNGLKILIIYPKYSSNVSPTLSCFIRNEQIVLESDIVVAFTKKDTGGTVNTIKWAKKHNKTIFLFGGK